MIKFLRNCRLSVAVNGYKGYVEEKFQKDDVLPDGNLTYCDGNYCSFEYENKSKKAGICRNAIQIL